MIRVYKVDGDHLVEVDGLSGAPVGDILWIDLLAPTPEEDRAVEDFLKLSIPTREDMEEIESSARLYDEGDASYMTMSAVAHISIDDPVKIPLTFILHKHTLITVRYDELLSFTQYVAAAKKKKGVLNTSPEGLFLDIVESVINRTADALEALGNEVEGVSRDIFRSKKTSASRKTGILQVTIKKIGAKGDMLGMLRESLSSISRLLFHFDAKVGETTPKGVKLKSKSLHKDVDTLADHANFLSGKMAFLLDATLGLINLEQNQIIKIFSVAAVVFLPPTLIASVYGMNFHDMPELDKPYAYPIALLCMVASAALPLMYFKKKGWL